MNDGMENYNDMDNFIKCSFCFMEFAVDCITHSPLYTTIEYCPFCGVELEDYEHE